MLFWKRLHSIFHFIHNYAYTLCVECGVSQLLTHTHTQTLPFLFTSTPSPYSTQHPWCIQCGERAYNYVPNIELSLCNLFRSFPVTHAIAQCGRAVLAAHNSLFKLTSFHVVCCALCIVRWRWHWRWQPTMAAYCILFLLFPLNFVPRAIMEYGKRYFAYIKTGCTKQ